jgi:hypothetical protein
MKYHLVSKISPLQQQTLPAEFHYSSSPKKVLQMTFIHASGNPSLGRVYFLDGESEITISSASSQTAKIRIDD